MSPIRARFKATPLVVPFLALATAGCPDGRSSSGPGPSEGAASPLGTHRPEQGASGGSAANPPRAAEVPACQVPRSEPPPSPASSLAECPEDPARPSMPEGRVAFPNTKAPALRVEIASTDPHRTHGLMFRPTLSEDEGMLFSWPTEAPRSFWMHNTCLALDMLFLDQRGFVVGILEQVPPWNEVPRRMRCPAAHVLEVRAGWARDHGVQPGAQATIEGAPG